MIRVIIAHQATAVANNLQLLLDQEEDIYVAGRATKEAELKFLLPQCDLALIGDTFQGEQTTNLIQSVTAAHENVALLVVGPPREPEAILPYLAAGARGYVVQSGKRETIAAKIKATAAEKAIISPGVASAVIERIGELAINNPTISGNQANQLAVLTPRQQEVLRLISQGLTNQEIADKLFIQKGTVKNHVHHILRKLDVDNRHDAAIIFEMGRPSTPAKS